MIGGMYLGDIVRRVILRMSQESDIFGPISSILSMPFVLRYIPIVSSSASASNGKKRMPNFCFVSYISFGEFSVLKISNKMHLGFVFYVVEFSLFMYTYTYAYV